MRNSLASILCTFILVIISSIAHVGSTQLTYDNTLPMPNDCDMESAGVSFVDCTMKRRTAFSHVDATSEFIFFSYSQDNCVDAYSYDSEFCFSIYLPAFSNGTIMVRCIDDTLFIRGKADVVYIYNGITQISVLSEEDAEENGYTYEWFRENYEEIGVNVDRKNISLIDENNHAFLRIETPSSIRRQLPYIDFGTNTDALLSLGGLAGLSVVGGTIMYKAFQEGRKKQRYRL